MTETIDAEDLIKLLDTSADRDTAFIADINSFAVLVSALVSNSFIRSSPSIVSVMLKQDKGFYLP